MKSTKTMLRALCAALVALMISGQSFASSTVINVKLWDKGEHSMDPLKKGVMLGMAMGGNMDDATMGIDAVPNSVAAGEITFEVTNVSKVKEHEMIVAPVKDESQPLPYDKGRRRVDEDAAGSLGEVSETEPGKSGTLTLTLKPGKYILYCNIAGHYALGMWTLINVK